MDELKKQLESELKKFNGMTPVKKNNSNYSIQKTEVAKNGNQSITRYTIEIQNGGK